MTTAQNCLIYRSNKSPYCDKCYNCTHAANPRPEIELALENWQQVRTPQLAVVIEQIIAKKVKEAEDTAYKFGWQVGYSCGVREPNITRPVEMPDAINKLIAQEADKLANKRVREVLERVMVGGLEETPERSLHNVMANIQAELDKGDSHGRSKS